MDGTWEQFSAARSPRPGGDVLTEQGTGPGTGPGSKEQTGPGSNFLLLVAPISGAMRSLSMGPAPRRGLGARNGRGLGARLSPGRFDQDLFVKLDPVAIEVVDPSVFSTLPFKDPILDLDPKSS